MTNCELVTARDLDAWCEGLASQSRLAILVRQLILATAPVTEITMPAREGVLPRGWDGQVRCPVDDPQVPIGLSGWELGTSDPPRAKGAARHQEPDAQAPGCRPGHDHVRRGDRAHLGGSPAVGDVCAFDAHDLELWMERVPSAHVRISEMLGREPRDVRTPDAWWETWSAQTDPALPVGFLLSGRHDASIALAEELAKPPHVITVMAASQTEALAVTCASLVDGGEEVGGSVLRPSSSPGPARGVALSTRTRRSCSCPRSKSPTSRPRCAAGIVSWSQ